MRRSDVCVSHWLKVNNQCSGVVMALMTTVQRLPPRHARQLPWCRDIHDFGWWNTIVTHQWTAAVAGGALGVSFGNPERLPLSVKQRGRLKIRDMKLRDMEMRHKKCSGGKRETWKMRETQNM